MARLGWDVLREMYGGEIKDGTNKFYNVLQINKIHFIHALSPNIMWVFARPNFYLFFI